MLTRVKRFTVQHRNQVIGAVIAVVVLTLWSALGHLPGLVWNGVSALAPGPSAEEQAVDRLLKPASESLWLTLPYTENQAARDRLEGAWGRLDPYRQHQFRGGIATPSTVSEAVTDRTNSTPVTLHGQAQDDVIVAAVDGKHLLQYYSLAEDESLVRCVSTVSKMGRITAGEQLRVEAIVVGWATDRPLAYAACPAVRKATAAVRQVDDLYQQVWSNSNLWAVPPTMVESARHLLIREWPLYRPDRIHSYVHADKDATLDGLFNDLTLDGDVVSLHAYIEQDSILGTVGENGISHELTLGTGADSTIAFCRTTSRERFQPGEFVNGKGIIIARGTLRASVNPHATFMVCPTVKAIGP